MLATRRSSRARDAPLAGRSTDPGSARGACHYLHPHCARARAGGGLLGRVLTVHSRGCGSHRANLSIRLASPRRGANDGPRRCRGELAAAQLALARVRAGGATGLVLAGPVAGAAGSAKRLTLLSRGSGSCFLDRRRGLTRPALSRLAAARPALPQEAAQGVPRAGGAALWQPANAAALARERETTGAGESKP